MNRVIKLLLVSDIFLTSGFGLIEPVMAIFIKDNIFGGQIYKAGIASALFLLTKSCVQLPFSRYVDTHDRSVLWLIIGSLCIAVVPFGYMYATRIEWIYAVQVIYGIGSGLAYPTWLGLWSTHLDGHHESFEWSLYSTMTGLGTAGAAATGAVLAQFIGFKLTFLFVGLLSLAGCGILFLLSNEKAPVQRKRRGKRIMPR
jgi:DHA1 family quinolone resistance protein-like MFS transporter